MAENQSESDEPLEGDFFRLFFFFFFCFLSSFLLRFSPAFFRSLCFRFFSFLRFSRSESLLLPAQSKQSTLSVHLSLPHT